MIPLISSPLLLQVLAQVPDPTNALPAWLTGGGIAAILVYLLVRAEKRNDVLLARLDTQQAAHEKAITELHTTYGERLAREGAEWQRRVDESEGRYRAMVDRYGDRLYAGLDALGQAAKLVQAVEPGGHHDRQPRG